MRVNGFVLAFGSSEVGSSASRLMESVVTAQMDGEINYFQETIDDPVVPLAMKSERSIAK